MTSFTVDTPETGALSPEQIATLSAAEQPTNQEQPQGDAPKFAGKFNSVEDLERGYAALEKKLGSAKAETPQEKPEAATEEKPAEEKPTEETTEVSTDEETYGKAVADVLKSAGLTGDELSTEFAEKGTLSEETFKKLNDAGFSKPVVEAYIKGLASDAAMTEATVQTIMDSVGGTSEYAKMCAWADASLPKDQVESFNNAVSSGDKNTAQWAVAALYEKFTSSVGKESTPIKANQAASDVTGYRDISEMKVDMKNPLYKTSEAFRQKVQQKIARSNLG